MAHKIAQVQEISPWEALLLAVKRAAAWAAFYESKLAEVENDDDLKFGGAAFPWVEASERVNEKLARWSKMAVDAGVQKILVEKAQADGALLARVLNVAIAQAGLGAEGERRLRAALRQAILAEGTGARPFPSAMPSSGEGEDGIDETGSVLP